MLLSGRHDASRDRRVVRKPVESVGIKAMNGRLTLLTRKLYNVLLCHAQAQGRSVERYRILLSELIRDAHFDSRDTSLIKDHLQSMQSTLVEWLNPTEWGSTQLLGTVRIFKNPGDGNLLWLEWEYPAQLKDKLIEPARYARLALRYQGLLRSGAALGLYEIAIRYATNPSHLTNRLPWEDWAQTLSGNPDRPVMDYKYVKRDLFRPAIAEVNALTDVRVDLIEHKRGRRVVELQFRVEPTTPILELGADTGSSPKRIDLSLVQRICRLGLTQDDAENLYANNDEEAVRGALEFVEARLRRGPAVESPAALFRWSLRHPEARKDASSPAQKEARAKRIKAVQVAEVESKLAALRAAFAAREMQKMQDIFADYAPTAREECLRDFEETQLRQLPLAIQRAFRGHKLANRLAATAFFEWLIEREGRSEASDGALLRFAAETRQLAPSGA
jgi:hypothetical protein